MPPTRAKIGPVRSRQAKATLAQKRALLLHWHKAELVPGNLPAPKPTISGQRRLGALLYSKANRGVQLFNAPIARMGMVHRKRIPASQRTEQVPTVQYPVGETDFNTWYQGRRSAEKRGWQKEKERLGKKYPSNKKAVGKMQQKRDEAAHGQFAFNLGINAILEVGNDGHGQPTHILLLKRPRNVPEAPHHWDYPAGLVRAKQNPMDVIRSRSSAETGVKQDDLQLIGPGLKPTQEPVYFALHRIDKATNYNTFVIQRVAKSAEEVRQTVQARMEEAQQKKDPWAPADFELVPRNPKAIREFLLSHDHTWMPEVLRLYARELYKTQKEKK